MKTKKEKELLNLLRTMIDTLPDFIYVKDTKSRFLLANNATVHLMGLTTPDELIGKSDFDFFPAELVEQYYADEQRIIKSGQPMINREEPSFDHKTGTMRWFLTTKAPFRDSRGNIAGIVGLNRDITDRKQVEEVLAQQTKERTTELETLQHVMTQAMSIAQRLGDSSEAMAQISTQMATESRQTSDRISIVSSNSQQISEHITTVSAAIEESAANVSEISRAITDVNEIIGKAVNITKDANTAITDLQAHSREIGEFSKMITTIAQQTRFLALNATIEAARAGDFGQGFKVVADEVKELARDTSIAAENISDKLRMIQERSLRTANAITEVVKIINTVSEASDSIATAILEQTQTTNEISRTIAHTAHGSDEITHTIVDVAAASQNSAKRATSVRDEARKLSSLAEELRQLMDSLKSESKSEHLNSDE